MAQPLFRDRRDAGRSLARLMNADHLGPDPVVLALPRGGVPVGYEVAAHLGAPLDVFLVRKLPTPGQPELAMGAMASGGVVVLNDDVVRALDISPGEIRRVIDSESRELSRRERAYREDRPPTTLEHRAVVLVDDGLATGASMRAAIIAVRHHRPARVVVAVPAAPVSTKEELEVEVDDVVCASTPHPFHAVGHAYWDFTQTSDEEVIDLLRRAAAERRLDGDRPPAPDAPCPASPTGSAM